MLLLRDRRDQTAQPASAVKLCARIAEKYWFGTDHGGPLNNVVEQPEIVVDEIRTFFRLVR